MAEPLRVLTSPVRATGGLRLAQLVALVSADAVVRYARGRGHDVTLLSALLTGDLGNQYAVEQDLMREGLDRLSMDRAAFAARVSEADAADRAAAVELLTGLNVTVAFDAFALEDDAVTMAARTAFVRLYEAGLLVREERVVQSCPRCATVIDAIDAEPGESQAQSVGIRVTPANSDPFVVDLVAAELLPGAVAIAVPSDDAAEGDTVAVPLVDGVLPVVADADATIARFVIPGHRAEDLELARRAGLAPVVVLDLVGTVTAAGPLAGLGRYAARAAAADLLAAEDAVDHVEEVAESVDRCRRCGTILVPNLGRHWFLGMTDLEVLVADHLRQDHLTVAPAVVREDILALAGTHDDWCLSHQLLAGQPVPVWTCLDCGQLAVAVEAPESCGKCMGPLVADDDVLDARFVGAVWPLAAAGWPGRERGPAELAPQTTLMIGPTGIASWGLRMAALGLRLADALPFCHLAVHVLVDQAWQQEAVADAVVPLLHTDRAATRAALVAGNLDVAAAIESTVAGDDAEIDAAMRAGTPASAPVALTQARSATATAVQRAAGSAIAGD